MSAHTRTQTNADASRPPRPESSAAQEAFARGLSHHKSGNLREAERLYCQVLDISPRHADCLHLLGLVRLQTGRLDHAAQTIRQAVAINPMAPLYQLSLGNVLTLQRKPDQAAVCYLRLLKLSPDNPEAHINLGNIRLQQGRFDQAIVHFERVLRVKPDYPSLHLNLGHALVRSGRAGDAVGCYRQALRLEPDASAIHNTLGNTYVQLGQSNAAMDCYRRALQIDPSFADAHNNLGTVLLGLGRADEALACFRRAIELKPDDADAQNNLGNALNHQGMITEALACYRAALTRKPDFAKARYNLGNVLRQTGDLNGATASFREAIAIDPAFADAHINLGGTFADQGKLDEALTCYDEALVLRPYLPDAHFNRALVLLARGDLAAGFAEYEWRSRLPHMMAVRPDFKQPQWRGEAAEGQTLLIHAEQGFGDTLQFCRYATRAAAQGLRVILRVPRPLARLLTGLADVAQIVAEDEDLPAFDLQCPMLSMPLALGTTLTSIPAQIPYLAAEAAAASIWQERLTEFAPGPRVGLVWAGSARNTPELAAVDRRRSIAPDRLAPLLDLKNVHFFSLQKEGPAASEAFPLIDFMPDMADFADTAALIANLDLVISVDTAVAHLAAALGKPVWLLNRFDSCWRWLTERNDSPWYPTLRLYRQPRPGDWEAVIAHVAEDLWAWAEAAIPSSA